MMKRFSRVALATTALFLSISAAQAQNTVAPALYGEIGYTHILLNTGSDTFHPGLVRALVGMEVNPYLSVEGMLAWGVRDDSAQISGVEVQTGASSAYGVFVKPQFSVTPQWQWFGRLGWVHFKNEVETSFGGFSSRTKSSDSDVAYGVGTAYQFTPRVGVSLDFMRYYDKNGSTADGLSAGLHYRF